MDSYFSYPNSNRKWGFPMQRESTTILTKISKFTGEQQIIIINLYNNKNPEKLDYNFLYHTHQISSKCSSSQDFSNISCFSPNLNHWNMENSEKSKPYLQNCDKAMQWWLENGRRRKREWRIGPSGGGRRIERIEIW